MNQWLGCLICVFKKHILSEFNEKILYVEYYPGEKMYTMCSRCHMPLVCYVEPKHPEVYNMIEDA